MEEHQKLRKKRAIRVAITELLMFFSVIALVVILTLIVLGYNFNINKIGTEETVIERSGLLQIASVPSGANVNLDENDIFARTTFSRTLSAGKHSIVLAKDGYDKWKKEITITEGLFYRLDYPQLFLKKRVREEIDEIPIAEIIEDEHKTKDEEVLTRIKQNIAFEEGTSVGFGEYLGDDYLTVVEKTDSGETRMNTVVIYSGSFTSLGFEANRDDNNEEKLSDGSESDLSADIEQQQTIAKKAKPSFASELSKLIKNGLVKEIYREVIPFDAMNVFVKGEGELIVIQGETENLIFDIESEKASVYGTELGEDWLNDFLKYKIEDGKLIVWDFDNTNRRVLVPERVVAERVLDDGTVENKVRMSKNKKYLFYYRLETVEKYDEDTGEMNEVNEKVLVREKIS